MGRMKDRIDFELGDLKFSDHLMQQVLERTCKEEENRQEEKWILMILELLQKESLSGFEILSELKRKSGETTGLRKKILSFASYADRANVDIGEKSEEWHREDSL